MIELRNLSKRFGELQANAGVDVRVARGTIHAIIGENGAGKSTAMKMLYGIYRPDGGEILIDGVARRWQSPRDAIRAGIGMVHQHFMLAGPYTALENVVLGTKTGPVIAYARTKKRLAELSARYGFGIDWDAPVERLAVGVQQRLEILKLLYQEASILILDEPTAVLTPQETADLFTNLKSLAREGKTVLIITHKLKEVMSVADQVTVFRAGKVVGERKVAETSPEELASLMVGRKVNLTIEKPPAPRVDPGLSPVLSVNLPGMNFSVAGGEVVGIAGVEGNGQSELLSHLIRRRRITMPVAPRWGVIPEDRHRDGLLLENTTRENFLLGLQWMKPFNRGGFIDGAALEDAVKAAAEEFDVRPRSPDAIVGRMSGGNQQKVIIAREFYRKPQLLIAAQPTRGVDVGAIEFIHRRILDVRAGGSGVLLVSSELDEILALSDRILVMYGGKIVAEFVRGEASEQELGLCMGGAHA